MPTANKNYFRQSLLEKYQKRITRLRKAVMEGKFSRYSADKKRMLLLSLSKYERQLAHWGVAFATGAALLLPIHPIHAQTPVPVGSEFRVNSNTTNQQQTPSVAVDSDGDFVVTWYSNYQDGSSTGVYAQRYDNTGTARGAEFRVNTYITSEQQLPSVAMDSDGDFVVAWSSRYQDGNFFGIYAQRYTLPPLLPIELLYFTGQVLSTTNILEWATATEKNTAWQIVERSANGLEDWTEIGRVAGAGTSTAPISYKISDENPLPLGLYRLVAEDFDGSIQHSEIISLQRSGSGLSILNVFPQPAGNELRLELYAPVSGIVTVSMTDILGRKVLNQECGVQRGIQQLVLDTSGLPPGRYQAMVSDGDRWVTRAVVK